MFFFSKPRFFVNAVCVHESEPKLNFEAAFETKFKTREEARTELEDVKWVVDCFPKYKITFTVEEKI